MSIVFVSNSYRIFIFYIFIGKWELVVRRDFDCLFHISVLTQAYLYRNDPVIRRYSFKRRVHLLIKIAIYPLVMSI